MLLGHRVINFFYSLFIIGYTLFPNSSQAQFTNASFWKNKPWSLQFTSSSQSITAGTCSGIATVKTYNPSGVLTNVSSNLTVSLSGPGTALFYSDSSCLTQITQVTIASGSNTANFYFVDMSTSTITLTAAATGFNSALQSQTINSNPYIWTGGGANANWATAANWSGGAAPGSTNVAIFNSTCSSNCSPQMAANVNVAGVRIFTGYSGTITQNAGFTVTIGTSGWVQSAGTFTGGNSAVTMSGLYYLDGGTYTATSGTWTISTSTSFTISGSPTFNANNGTLSFTGTGTTVTPGSVNYYNVTFAGINKTHSLNNGTMIVNGTLTLDDTSSISGNLNSGTVLAYGNVVTSDYGKNGSALIRIVGSSNQSITGSTNGRVPNFEIASTGGTVSCSSSIIVNGDFTYTSGTVNSGTSTFIFANTSTITPGSMSFYNVTFTGSIKTQNLNNGTMTVNGTLTLDDTTGSTGSINSGTILAYGNVVIADYGKGGSALIRVVGASNQSFTGTANGKIPNLEIASTGGTVSFISTISIYGDFTYTSGTVNSGTSTFIFANTSTITPGSMSFYNVTFTGSNKTQNLNNGTMTVNGTLTLDDTNTISGNINSGTILAYGNVVSSNYGKYGSAVITLSGSGAQTISQSATGKLPTANFVVNKTGGSTTQVSNMTMTGAGVLTLTAGNWSMAGYSLTINGGLSLNGNTMTKSSGVLTVSGTTVGTGSLYGGTVDP